MVSFFSEVQFYHMQKIILAGNTEAAVLWLKDVELHNLIMALSYVSKGYALCTYLK